MNMRRGTFFFLCLLLLSTGVVFRSSGPSEDLPAPANPLPGIPLNAGSFEPLLLHDTEEIGAFLEAFPADSYDIAEVTGLGSFYLDKFLPPGPIKSALRNDRPFEEGTIELMRAYLRPGQVAIDVGAHIGTLTLPMAEMVGPQGMVFAFEPQRKIFRELFHNLALNGITNVVPLRYALGDTTEIVEMNPPLSGNEGGTSVGSGGDQVELRPLDTFSLPEVSFMKIDVEGFEDFVLDGAAETIRRSGFPPMIVEIQGGKAYPYTDTATRARIDATREKLEAFGYHVLWVGSFLYLAVLPSAYELGTIIDFTDGGGADSFQTGYWSQPEEGGRFLFDDCPAGVVLSLSEYPVSEDLELFIDGFVVKEEEAFSREFTLEVNGAVVAEWTLRSSEELQRMHPRLVIPEEMTRDGLLRIEILSRDLLEVGEGGAGRTRIGVRQMALLRASEVAG